MTCATSGDSCPVVSGTFQVDFPVALFSSRLVWVAVLLALAVQLCELYSVYRSNRRVVVHSVKDRWSTENVWENLPVDVKFRYLLFATRRFPISSMIFLLGPLFVVAILSWWNLLDRSEWVGRLLQSVLLWAWCMPLSLFIYNGACLLRYLPRTLNEWSCNARSVQWWGWVAVKLLFGSTDEKYVWFTIVWYVSTSWVVWPFRYFYYYRSSAFAANLDTADVFVLNMILHLALLIGWLLCLHILAFGVSKPISRWRVLTNSWPYITLFVAVCSVVCILRVVWFLFTNWVSLWGAWVILGFTHAHVVIALFAYPPLCTVLLQRDTQLAKDLRSVFVSSYSLAHGTPDKTENVARPVPQSPDANHEINDEANFHFDDLLDAVCVKLTFTQKTDRNEQSGESTGESDSKLFLSYLENAIKTALAIREMRPLEKK